jgi:hypothetical protein
VIAPDTADLIERLNRVESSRKFGVTTAATTNWHRNPDGPEAAKAIEALLSAAREGERLKALSLRLIDWIENEVGAELPFGDNDADLIATVAALQSETPHVK